MLTGCNLQSSTVQPNLHNLRLTLWWVKTCPQKIDSSRSSLSKDNQYLLVDQFPRVETLDDADIYHIAIASNFVEFSYVCRMFNRPVIDDQ